MLPCLQTISAISLFLAATTQISQAASRNIVSLKLAPSSNATEIAQTDVRAPALRSALPVTDPAKAAAGWKTCEHTLGLVGYIPKSNVSENLTIKPNTPVYLRPDSNGEILTNIEGHETYTVRESSGDWMTVRLKKSIAIYFTDKPQQSAVASSTEARSIIQLDGKANLKSTLDETASTALPVVVSEGNLQPSELPRRPDPNIGTQIRILSGKLVRKINVSGPRYPLRLHTSSGKRLAYIDMSNLFIGNIRPYLNQTVMLQGEVRPLVPGSKELVIMARTIRLAN